MMKDSRVSGLATEFTGNWLAFRLFETNNAVDRQRFPQFNNDLREAMFQEPIRYVEDTIQNNRSVLDLLYGTDTFVTQDGGMQAPAGASCLARRPGRTPADHADARGVGGARRLALFAAHAEPRRRGARTSEAWPCCRRLRGRRGGHEVG